MKSYVARIALVVFSILAYAYNSTAQQLTGDQLFLGNRCAGCHTIGRGTFVGPDLYEVHKKYSKDEIISWMVNSQDIYKRKQKMPVNEGFPPMPPMNVRADIAEKIYAYLKDFKIPEDKLEKGIIKGFVINKTLDEKVERQEVKLTSYLGDILKEEYSSMTNSKGEYVFKELNWNRAYVISLTYKGVEYSTGKINFSPRESTISFDLPVYDTSADSSKIILDSSHIILDILKDRVSVAELLVFRNSSSSVYIGDVDIDGQNRKTLRINIPRDAVSVQFHHGLTDKTAMIKEGEIISTLSMQPGVSRVVLSYEIPSKGKTEIVKKLNYFTSSQLILLSDNEYKADVLGLTGGESVEMNAQKFIKWSGNDLKKGHEISITISKPLFGDDITKWLILMALIVIIAVSVAYSLVFKKTNSNTSKDVNSKREDLIKFIAELDDRYEAGDIEQAEYKKLREETKDKVIKLTKDII